MKIVITGGAGFIGSQLGFYLMDKGHEVVLVDNLKYGYLDNLSRNGIQFPRFMCLDIRDVALESIMRGVDVVFHFGGISSLPECQSNPNEAYSVNVAGTGNVLEMARRNGVKKVVFSSTSAIYENETVFPTPESIDAKPSLVYCLTKKASEELCQSFRDVYGMDITTLRFFNVYGPHMDYQRPNPPLVSYLVKCFLAHEAPILHSDGKQARDMVYVSDVVSLAELVMTHPKAINDVFNVGSGTTVTVQEIFEGVAKAFGINDIVPTYRDAKFLWEKYSQLFNTPFPFSSAALNQEVNKYTLASTKKCEELLGWKAKVSIAEGLQATVDFTRSVEQKKKIVL